MFVDRGYKIKIGYTTLTPYLREHSI